MSATVDPTRRHTRTSVWYHELRRAVADWDLTPGQIVGLYLVLGFLALYVSDVLLVRAFDDPATLDRLQAVKGGVEVVATGGLVYVLARRSRRSLRTTNARLERQQAELQVLHRVLRHNLRHDVTVVEGYAAILEGAVDEPEHRAWCEKISAGAERIIHYTDQARKINQVTAEDALRPVDLGALARRVATTNEALAGSSVDVEVSTPERVTARAHPMLEAAVDELVTNAVEHHDGERPSVALRVDPEAGPAHCVEVVVSDDGPGIPKGVRSTMDQRGETPLLHLEGLGLWLVSWVTTVSDGELALEDRADRGTEVRLRLQRANWGMPAVADG